MSQCAGEKHITKYLSNYAKKFMSKLSDYVDIKNLL